LHNEELLDLYPSPSNILVIKSEYEMGRAYVTYVGKCEGRRPIWETQAWLGE